MKRLGRATGRQTLVSLSPSLRRCFLGCGLLSVLAFSSNQQTRRPLDAVLASFLAGDPRNLDQILRKVWTPPADAEERAAALASFEAALPIQGEIKDIVDSQRRKLASVRPVLTMHGRQALGLRVIAIPQAYVGLYRRAIILVSIPVLNLLSSEELQAIAAHEASHDVIWSQWESARDRRDFRRLEELEFHCDGIAIVTLQRLGIDVSRWLTALEKIERYNQRRFGKVAIAGYPSLESRKRFARAIIRWLRTFGDR